MFDYDIHVLEAEDLSYECPQDSWFYHPEKYRTVILISGNKTIVQRVEFKPTRV